jgi:competence protein ComEC
LALSPRPLQARLALILLILAAVLVSLGRALAAPFLFSVAYRCAHRRAVAFGAGLVLGITAGASLEGLPRLGLPAEAVRGISGIMAEDPRETSTGRGMGRLDLRGASGAGGLRATAQGRVLVFFPAEALPRLRDFGRGAEVFVEGDFVKGDTAQNSGGFGNGEPLFRARSVHIVKGAPAWEQWRTGARLAILDKLEGHAWGGLGAALILGVKDSLDGDLAKKYQEAGCAHVLALSGMHLAIVAAIVAFFLRRPLGLKAAAVAGSVFILLYVALIGVQPSLERSAIMYLLGAAAILGFLPRQPLSLLAMAFIIQIVLRPDSGTSISFILSYLALAGILTVGEFLHGLLRGRVPEFIASPLSASLGAYVATQAVVAGAFGIVRPVGILAGLVIVPLTTAFMVGAMAALALGFVAPVSAGLLGAGLDILYRLLDALVSLAAMTPGIAAHGWARELVLALLTIGLCLYPGYPYSKRRLSLAPFN